MLSLSILVTAGAGYAQQPATQTGLLGQRYVNAAFSVTNLRAISDDGYGTSIGINLPVCPNADVSFGYDYDWLDVLGAKAYGHTLTAAATFYARSHGIKPFVGLGVGYQWSTIKVSGFKSTDSNAIWAAGLGVEIPSGFVTLTPSVSYTDAFKSNSGGGQWSYGVEANHWFTSKVAGFADVTYADPTGSGGESWIYRVGVRVKF